MTSELAKLLTKEFKHLTASKQKLEAEKLEFGGDKNSLKSIDEDLERNHKQRKSIRTLFLAYGTEPSIMVDL